MDVTLEQPDLARALRSVARVVPARFSLPVLRSVLLEGDAGHLILRATDLELSVIATVPAQVAAPGRVAVPARLVAEYAAQLPAAPVRLRLDEATTRLRVASGRFAANLASLNADEFPQLPPADGEPLDVDARELREAIGRVTFAASRDDSRPVFRSVLLRSGPDGLTLAAADGFRLARARVPAAGAAAAELLVPVRAVVEFGRALAEVDAARLTYRGDAPHVHLEAGDTVLIAQVAAGRFPDIEPVLSQPWGTRVAAAAADFRQAVRVAGLFGTNGSGSDSRPVVLDASPGRLRLSARGDETGDAEAELRAVVDGESHQSVVLNTRLLADVVDAASGPELVLTWHGASRPVAIRMRHAERTTAGGGDPDGSDSLDAWAVMPLLLPQQDQVTGAATSPDDPAREYEAAPSGEAAPAG
jgi:DNA polymerase-3 subunit beta